MSENNQTREKLLAENSNKNPTLYGEHIEPISTLEKIAKALGISSSELLK